MSNNAKFTKTQVAHIARLANLPLSEEQTTELAAQFDETLDTIATLKEVDTESVVPTHHVTGLVNVMRDDQIDPTRTLSQTDALSSSHHTHKGYFVVGALIDNE